MSLAMLTEEQKKNPETIVEGFLSDINLEEIRKNIVDCLKAALTEENNYFNTAKDRFQIIYFFNRLEEMIEATYLLKNGEKILQRSPADQGQAVLYPAHPST